MIRRHTKKAKEKSVRRCDPDYAIELLGRMNRIETWTKEKIALKNEVIRNLQIGKHVIFEANYGYYGISRVGQYYHETLIDKKQSHMRPVTNNPKGRYQAERKYPEISSERRRTLSQNGPRKYIIRTNAALPRLRRVLCGQNATRNCATRQYIVENHNCVSTFFIVRPLSSRSWLRNAMG